MNFKLQFVILFKNFTSLPLGLGEGATRPFIVDLAFDIFQYGFMNNLLQHDLSSVSCSAVFLDGEVETILMRGEHLRNY